MSTPDLNLYSLAGARPLGSVVLGDLWADPRQHSDALKVTDCTDGVVEVHHVKGGREDCCDINNHCREILVMADLWEPQGDYVFTVKGGSARVTLVGRIRGHGRVVDVDLGNISDQSDDITGPVLLNLTHESGDPITVRVLGATRPIILNPAQRYQVNVVIPGVFRSLFLKAYKLLKRFGLPI